MSGVNIRLPILDSMELKTWIVYGITNADEKVGYIGSTTAERPDYNSYISGSLNPGSANYQKQKYYKFHEMLNSNGLRVVVFITDLLETESRIYESILIKGLHRPNGKFCDDFVIARLF